MPQTNHHPDLPPTLQAALAASPTPLVLDGASGTHLQDMGVDVSGDLWSAAILATEPELVSTMHRDYLQAGARIVESLAYQASVPAFVRAGYSTARAQELMASSWYLAQNATQDYTRSTGIQTWAASALGPYGVHLADGSEYSGAYSIERGALYSYHRDRAALLYEAGCRLFAWETIPRVDEALLIADVMSAYPSARWWLSCSSGPILPDGGDLTELTRRLARVANPPIAVGVNCCSADSVEPALLAVDTAGLPGICYPNSGHVYSAATQTWSGDGSDDVDLAVHARAWTAAGARIIGGCCRTTPEDIRALAAAIQAGSGSGAVNDS
ncbi:homocysteine S-methyltransferase [Brevibacterium sp. 50QC2O2]|uniref:homocysteine S-methyltransferase n=1 Tax=Brevibacterium TaxID=1696 RepID=UPI00211CC193|nr:MULTISPECIES: homocysteine S-methyltransferase [unclassified Brevibacterium]MCQ9384691.1 homocysteine S-methyltransferase [Brevibacterium sp. 68QC2CO]MCQ9389277.1 homocysteine S-methyltransferase [Brevibacterium sp. 50QC2O2]